MLMVFLMFAKWWKFITKKINYIINIYFKFFEKMDNVYNDLKENFLNSNKFDIRIFYVFHVGIIIIIFQKITL
jgi:hypothetical protein